MKNFFIRQAFNTKIRKKVWKRLSTQIARNISLNSSLEMLRDQYLKKNNTSLANMFSDVFENYNNAQNLATSFRNYIPYDELTLIASAESSGKMAEGFELASKIVTAKQKINSALRSALAYPLFLFSLFLVLILTVSFVLIPNFALISNPETWQGSAYFLYLISSFVASPFGIIFAVFLCISIFAMIYSFPNLTGKARIFLDRFPPYSFYRLTVGVTWLFAFSALMSAGKQQIDILEDMMLSDTSSPYLKERVRAIHAAYIGNSFGFGTALALSNMNFPDEELIDDLQVYSEMSNFEEMLKEIANDWLYMGVEKIQEISKIVNISFVLVITALIILVILAFQSLQQTLAQGV